MSWGINSVIQRSWALAQYFSKPDHPEACRPIGGRLARNWWPVVPLVACRPVVSVKQIFTANRLLNEVLELKF
ncbi:hypothetical protein CsSME_00001683 [Camellia sinensis var. sinensis]